MEINDKISLGISYAEKSFLQEESHLKIDKNLIKEKYNLNDKNVLDFGCGMGGMSVWLAKQFHCIVDGIDIDPYHIEIANKVKEKHEVQNVNFYLLDILAHDLNKKYDFILLNDVAEHIPLDILEKILARLKECLTNGGSIFLSYPPWESPYASHLNRAIPLPWCQYLPDSVLFKWLSYKDLSTCGSKDLKQEYTDLNRLTHHKLNKIIKRVGLNINYRKSNSKLNKIPVFKNLNLRAIPFIITKEFLILS